jgi:hypothetical protein
MDKDKAIRSAKLTAAGLLDKARARTAVTRAGGQIAPSKYLPDVPRQVHAGGGKVDFVKDNHPDVPDVVYHGTNQDIQSFDPEAKRSYDIDPRNPDSTNTGWFGKGHYFTPRPKIASHYADEAARRHSSNEGAQVYPVHLSMKNPFVVNMKDADSGATTLDKALNNAGVPMHPRGYRMPSEQTAALIAMGHDGVIAKREGKTEEIVAFHPHQIKSAIGNQGTFDPNDPDITKAEGGRIHAEDGGKMELRSRAAEAIRNQPQLKGNVNQLLAVAAKGKGVKQAELANAGRPSGNIVSKEELAKHFEDAVPKVQVKELKNREPKPLSSSEMAEYRRLEADPFGYGQDGYDRLQELEDRQHGEIKARYQQYTLPQGENYREHLLHLPAEHGPDSWTNFRSSHWETPNVIAHLRMKDRDNGKTLHVEEVQSDWGQEGRERGFYDIAKPFHVFDTKTGQTVHEASTADEAEAVADKLGPQYDYQSQHDDMPPKGPYVGNTQHWTDLAVKHALTEAAKGGHDRVVFSPGEANADLYGQRTPITNARLVWGSPETGYLYTRKKDAKYDSDAIQFQGEKHLNSLLGKQHAKALLAQDGLESSISEPDMHLGGHGMVDYYNNIVHPSALKLLQQHDPSIKPESYDLPNGYKGFSLPMTDTARQSILKNGFGAFKRGGMVNVDAALALTRRFTKDGAGATMALKPKGK